MTAVYSIQYYDDWSLLPRALEWTSVSDCVVWCQDDFPWQPDPQRDGSHARARSQRSSARSSPSIPTFRRSSSKDLRKSGPMPFSISSFHRPDDRSRGDAQFGTRMGAERDDHCSATRLKRGVGVADESVVPSIVKQR